MPRVLIALLAPVALTGVATARPGDLDPTFGDSGRVFVDVAQDSDAAATVLLQPDGKIVVGRSNDATDDDFSVLRFNPDGSPDTTFDGDARTTLDLPAHKGTTLVVRLQADDKIVAAGTARTMADARTMFGLVRYNADGSVDTGFGAGGVVIHDLGGCCDRISSIVQQPDGRLVAAGETGGGASATPDMAFVRFNADGSLDRSFGENGTVIINFHESNGHDSVRWLVQQPDGALIATGVATPSNPYSHQDMPIVRLLADGLPDPTLGGDGRVTIELRDPSGQGVGNVAEASWLASEADGRIVVVGNGNRNAWDYGNDTPLMARVNSDGSPDSTFGDGGTALIGLHGAYLQGVVIEPNGPIYLAGDYFNDHFVARVSRAGALDATFGVEGVAIIDSGDGNEAPNARFASLVRQPDGRIVTVSSTTASEVSPGSERIMVARLLVGDTDGHAGLLGFHGAVSGEENHVVAVRLRRTGGSSGAVSVDYATASGSATSSADFSAANGTMSWSDGDTADKTIEINIFADEIDEGSESFLIELSNPSGGALLAATELAVQIADAADNDPPPDTSGGGNGGGGGAIGLVFLVSMMLLVTAASSRGGRSASRSWQWRRKELPGIPAARRDARPRPRGASPVHDRECHPRA